MNKIKISDHQLMIATSGFAFGTAPMLLTSIVTTFAKQDAWVSAIFATIIGLLFIWLYTYLGSLYPDKTFVEIIQLLLGKWLGGFVSLNFILLSFIAPAQVIWYVGNFITTNYLFVTPLYAIHLLYLIVVAIALLYGLEAMFRTIEVLFSFAFPLYIISMLFLIPNFRVDNLFPIMEKGIFPVLKGTVPILSLSVCPLIFLNMIYPVNINDINKARSAIFKGYLLGLATAFVSVLICILVLGSSITGNSRFPLFIATREIDIGIIFTRVEAIVALVWLIVTFISTFFYLYGGIIGLSQILKLKDYKRIVLPVCLIILVISGFIYKNAPYEINWDTYVWPPYIFTFSVILPIVLLIISGLRKPMRN